LRDQFIKGAFGDSPIDFEKFKQIRLWVDEQQILDANAASRALSFKTAAFYLFAHPHNSGTRIGQFTAVREQIDAYCDEIGKMTLDVDAFLGHLAAAPK
jgi:hypothetical protein